MNSVTIIGNLTRDPEMKGSGESRVCRMRVAESSGSSDAAPLYIEVAAFGRQAESCQRYLRRGRPVAVSGRLRFREWQGEDGGRRSGYSIAADRVQFLAGPGNGTATSADTGTADPAQPAEPAAEAPAAT